MSYYSPCHFPDAVGIWFQEDMRGADRINTIESNTDITSTFLLPVLPNKFSRLCESHFYRLLFLVIWESLQSIIPTIKMTCLIVKFQVSIFSYGIYCQFSTLPNRNTSFNSFSALTIKFFSWCLMPLFCFLTLWL